VDKIFIAIEIARQFGNVSVVKGLMVINYGLVMLSKTSRLWLKALFFEIIIKADGKV